jgi:hypothetical protein
MYSYAIALRRDSLREMKLHSEQYESVVTPLALPRGAAVWPPREIDDKDS